MHDHGLKEYQVDCLEALAKFCDQVRAGLGQGRRMVQDAFQAVTRGEFLDVPQLPEVPYVCLHRSA